MTITGKDFASANKRRFKEFDDIYNRAIRIQSLTSKEMRSIKRKMLNKTGDGLNRKFSDKIEEMLVASCMVDESGNKIFTEQDVLNGVFDDTDGALITQVFNECKEHTGFNQDSDFEAVEVEVKNSGKTDGEHSNSVSLSAKTA